MAERTPITTYDDLIECQAELRDIADVALDGVWFASDDFEDAVISDVVEATHEANRLIDLLDAANQWRA